MTIKKAHVKDVKPAHKLINDFAAKQVMLPRPINVLYENLRDFYICKIDDIIIGVCALHIMWEDLAEIKSLAVMKEHQRKGIGNALVELCIQEAKDLGLKKVMALTYVPKFFYKQGFKTIDKAKLPQKTWGECIHCPKFPDCDENALLLEI